MPKIESNRALFYSLLDYTPTAAELEEHLAVAKAELDSDLNSESIKFELNDTNRPDLWSAAGLARQLNMCHSRSHFTTQTTQTLQPHTLHAQYPFFSTPDRHREYGERLIEVAPELRTVRPYIVAFELRAPSVDDALLKELIQSQEKICAHYGRKRRSIAMGIYKADSLHYPLHYRAVDPATTRFVPLDMDTELTLQEIVATHPKGVEYGHIISKAHRWPLVLDNHGQILSMPPIINSNDIGKVEVGDTHLLVELTGTDLRLLITACNAVACDCADMGLEVFPVAVRYPYTTELGATLVCPLRVAQGISVSLTAIAQRLGRSVALPEASASLTRMGFEVESAPQAVTAYQPPWRNDCMHPVDIIEDIMIGCGVDSFTPLLPTDYTVGRLLPIEEQARVITTIMIGLGFQEMLFNYLVSGSDFIDKMYPPEARAAVAARMVAVANPLSEKYSFVRNSIVPNLLAVESSSANAVYPHHIFEVGKIARRSHQANYGSITETALGFLSADTNEGFSAVNERLSALMYYLNFTYTLRALRDSRFLIGRCAEIIVADQVCGIFGEINPQVLRNWGIERPCSACEFVIPAH